MLTNLVDTSTTTRWAAAAVNYVVGLGARHHAGKVPSRHATWTTRDLHPTIDCARALPFVLTYLRFLSYGDLAVCHLFIVRLQCLGCWPSVCEVERSREV